MSTLGQTWRSFAQGGRSLAWHAVLALYGSARVRFSHCWIMARYVDISSSNFHIASSDFVAFDKSVDRLHVYRHVNYWVKQTIFERRLSNRGDNCCFISWSCLDASAVPPLILSGLFEPVSDWWRAYEYSRLLFVSTPIVLRFYLNLVISRRAPVLIFGIASSEFCVFALVLSFFSTGWRPRCFQ